MLFGLHSCGYEHRSHNCIISQLCSRLRTHKSPEHSEFGSLVPIQHWDEETMHKDDSGIVMHYHSIIEKFKCADLPQINRDL